MLELETRPEKGLQNQRQSLGWNIELYIGWQNPKLDA